jgi:hypothetical protein
MPRESASAQARRIEENQVDFPAGRCCGGSDHREFPSTPGTPQVLGESSGPVPPQLPGEHAGRTVTERDRLPAGCGAGIVDGRARRTVGEPGHQGLGAILHHERPVLKSGEIRRSSRFEQEPRVKRSPLRGDPVLP